MNIQQSREGIVSPGVNNNCDDEEDFGGSCHVDDDDESHSSLTTAAAATTTTTTCALTQQTIQRMQQQGGLALNPTHYHSFQPLQQWGVVWRMFHSCQLCQERLLGGQGSWQSSPVVVRCVACGFVAHRKCTQTVGAWRREDCCSVQWDRRPGHDSSLEMPQSSLVQLSNSEENSRHGQHHDEEDAEDEETMLFVYSCDESHDGPIAATPPRKPKQQQQQQQQREQLPAPDSCTEQDRETNEVVQLTQHPFATVARVLQENILASFRKGDEAGFNTVNGNGHHPNTGRADHVHDNDYVHTEMQPPLKRLHDQFKETMLSSTQARLGTAAVAGGIAGGVAGLVLAGPAGAYAGSQMGRIAFTLGVLAEGSVTVGVVVASIATGTVTAQQLQQQHDRKHKILHLGEAGTARKLLLVRPNIQIDPVWDLLVAEARATTPVQCPSHGINDVMGGGTIPFLPKWLTNYKAPELDTRYKRDSDIIETSQDEIPTEEKVFLLVSRILNDKTSLPGHVYRTLLEAFPHRCNVENSSDESPRSRRDDVHAIIKHVAALLLEIRNELATSPTLTELTAVAVESLIFGQVYDAVWDEITSETRDRDTALLQKVKQSSPLNIAVSESALEALCLVSESHTSVDKLRYCVRFLERLSEHVALDADSLLKLACQHLLVSVDRSPHSQWHAEVTFLEEFTRDEQLLRGREGYALVTLQAALHFIDTCTNLQQIGDDCDLG